MTTLRKFRTWLNGPMGFHDAGEAAGCLIIVILAVLIAAVALIIWIEWGTW